ncbi:hypothetical protein AB0756_38090 [Tolypothrix campylonemoides VB511288_2]|uniref:Uncharacterized protein n=1 Tax=Tolypothrix campylonemoides VB511288_2 TaxID=3232311 RepID=A0ABW8XLX0_9CYAN
MPANTLSRLVSVEISIETVPTQSNAPRPYRADSGGEGVCSTAPFGTDICPTLRVAGVDSES